MVAGAHGGALLEGNLGLLLKPLLPLTSVDVSLRRDRYGGPAFPEELLYVLSAHMAFYLGTACLLWRLAPRHFARAVRRCETPETR